MAWIETADIYRLSELDEPESATGNALFPNLIMRCFQFLAATALLISASPSNAAPEAAEGQWKTAFYKRGFVGSYQAAWADGVNSTLRMRVPIPFDGTQVRFTLTSMRDSDTVLSKLSLAKAKDNTGTIEGKAWGLNFAGTSNVTIAARQADVISDAASIPLTQGDWYLQQSYASDKYLYAYGVDGFFSGAGDQHDKDTLTGLKAGTWPGNVYRVEVFTADKRPIVLCYGDSITNGFRSTPNSGHTYPEILGKLLGRPTLNLGVNGDLFSYVGGAPSLIRSCNGVESVIVLMGINDIIGGKITTVDEYAKIASNLVATLKHDGKKIYLGTITPSAGYAAFDKDPTKETLRQSINNWIRKESGADAIIDFDAALSDPDNLSRMRAEYQSDWLHPNDAGYQKMAETAAAVLRTAL